jgi:acyl-CoA thioester hydrolase
MSTWSSPVRYGECDQQGVVFNAHYLAWADEALASLLSDLGTPYETLLARGLDTAVVATELVWSSPARWGDVVDVDGAIVRIGSSSFTAELTIRVGEQPCCTVRTTYVLHDADRTPVRVPEDVRGSWLSG